MKILPGIYQLVNGEVSVGKMKDVDVEDLLGREPIRVNMKEIFRYLQGKTILVTGGGGSIGSELCRQIAAHNPKRLIIFDIYENNAYDIEQELKARYPELNLTVLIGSVRDSRRVNWVFETYHPDIVYHAAAHKHVPLMENSPCEAIKNNVLGTYKTAYAALKYGCSRFVLISTDKAVNPTNIMGASKRLCEMVIQALDMIGRQGREDLLPRLASHLESLEGNLPVKEDYISRRPKGSKSTEFVAVRFGNVLGSNGSVIPLFKKQIEAGGPVTVTHPDIIRYFMTIPEAVSLVLQAGVYAQGGEIFVLDMGAPVRIDTLARNLIKLSGYKPDEDIAIVYTGLRPGEKLYEEKLMAEEGLTKTANDLIYVGKPVPFDVERFLRQLQVLAESVYNSVPIATQVAEMVPTFHRPETDLAKGREVYEALLNEATAVAAE
jgi:FlaA1/EpsC-like NDP-sugar epimerase